VVEASLLKALFAASRHHQYTADFMRRSFSDTVEIDFAPSILIIVSLLRNCALEPIAGVTTDEGEAEIGGALTQAAKDSGAVLSVVGGGPRIPIPRPVLERALDEDRELAGGGGDGLGPCPSDRPSVDRRPPAELASV